MRRDVCDQNMRAGTAAPRGVQSRDQVLPLKVKRESQLRRRVAFARRARLVLYTNVEGDVASGDIDTERQGHPECPLVHQEALVQTRDLKRMWCRCDQGPDRQPVLRDDLNRQRDKAFGRQCCVDVDLRFQLECQLQAQLLVGAISRRVKPGDKLDTWSLGSHTRRRHWFGHSEHLV